MIILCPHCGHRLHRPLVNGMCSCDNCLRICETDRKCRVLSASWNIRKKNVTDPLTLVSNCGITEEDAETVLHFVLEECMSHDEFLKVIKEQGLFLT